MAERTDFFTLPIKTALDTKVWDLSQFSEYVDMSPMKASDWIDKSFFVAFDCSKKVYSDLKVSCCIEGFFRTKDSREVTIFWSFLSVILPTEDLEFSYFTFSPIPSEQYSYLTLNEAPPLDINDNEKTSRFPCAINHRCRTLLLRRVLLKGGIKKLTKSKTVKMSWYQT